MTDYQELVMRLRTYRPTYGWDEELAITPTPSLGEQAASAIETLRRERDEAHQRYVDANEARIDAEESLTIAYMSGSADGRDALRALLREAGEALQPMVEPLRDNYSRQYDTFGIRGGAHNADLRFEWTLGDFRRARAVLARIKEVVK